MIVYEEAVFIISPVPPTCEYLGKKELARAKCFINLYGKVENDKLLELKPGLEGFYANVYLISMYSMNSSYDALWLNDRISNMYSIRLNPKTGKHCIVRGCDWRGINEDVIDLLGALYYLGDLADDDNPIHINKSIRSDFIEMYDTI